MTMRKKITRADFLTDPELHVQLSRGREVARALDVGAPKLPYAVTLTSVEFGSLAKENFDAGRPLNFDIYKFSRLKV